VRSLAAGESYGLVKLTPAHLDLMSHHLSPAATSVGTLVIGGEAPHRRHGEALAARRSRYADRQRVRTTETVVGLHRLHRAAATGIEGPVPIGRPVANARVALLDERLIPCRSARRGSCSSRSRLARGYQGRPDLTATAFLPDPSGTEPGARLYRTGIAAATCPTATSSIWAAPTGRSR